MPPPHWSGSALDGGEGDIDFLNARFETMTASPERHADVRCCLDGLLGEPGRDDYDIDVVNARFETMTASPERHADVRCCLDGLLGEPGRDDYDDRDDGDVNWPAFEDLFGESSGDDGDDGDNGSRFRTTIE